MTAPMPQTVERYERFITLREAARQFNLAEAEIRRAASTGSLRCIGSARIRTRASWVEDYVCRESERPRGSISTPSEHSGLSEMDRASSAQAALSQSVVELRRGLRNTSGTSTNRSAGRTR